MERSDVRFARPPVRVVELSIFFETIEGLQASHLSRLREAWRDEYPDVSEQPPSSPPRVDRSVGARGSVGWPCPEVQFSTRDGEQGLAIQSDRIIRRWYFGDQQYPGFETLSSDLASRLEQFRATVADELAGKELTFTAAQCWYVNEIEGISDIDLATGVLTGWSGSGKHSDLNQWAMARIHKCNNPALNGCSITLSVDGNQASDSPVLIIDSVADEARDKESPIDMLARAHDQLIREFMEVTNDVQRKSWGALS